MKVNEIFLSIQGESLSSGFPTVFVRFAGCNLRCSFCDTTYAYDEGREMTPGEVYAEIERMSYKRVCLTGGEPLLQYEIAQLLELLEAFTVTIETNGSVPIGRLRLGSLHTYVMDMKAPSSGCAGSMDFTNFEHLRNNDEIKFVIGNEEDYEWAKTVMAGYYRTGVITFSPVFGKIGYSDLVERILRDRLDVRFQLQLHKLIWEPERRGV